MKKYYTTILIFIALLYLLSYIDVLYYDFYPINGLFQVYNGVRRVGIGQIPFQDFYYYIGLGPLVISSIPQLIHNVSFGESVIWEYFFNYIAVFISIWIMLKFVIKDRRQHLCLVIALTIFTFICAHLTRSMLFEAGIMPQNSLKSVRLLSVFIYVITYFWAINKKQILLPSIIIGVCYIWSNDATAALVMATAILILNSLIFRKNIVQNLVLFSLSGVLAFIYVSLITHGNVTHYINYSKAVADNQFWYFDIKQNKNVSIFVVFDYLYKIGYTLGLLFFVTYFTRSKPVLFLSITILLQGFAYFVSNDSTIFAILLEYYLSLVLFVLIWQKYFTKYDTKLVAYSILMLIVLMVPLWHKNSSKKDNLVYDAQLKYNIAKSKAQSLSYVITKYNLDDHQIKFFSLYSSALNVKTNRYNQDFDYIIHAFGGYKESYLEQIKSADYIETPSLVYLDYWMFWIRNTNYVFFEYLFTHFEPVEYASYFTLWKRVDTPIKSLCAMPSLSVTQQDNNSYIIKVIDKSLLNQDNIVASIRLSYKTSYTGMLDKMKHLLYRVTERVNYIGYDSTRDDLIYYGMPVAAQDYLIPILLTNGEGDISLSIPKEKSAHFQITDIKIEGCYLDKELEYKNQVHPYSK